MANTYIKIASVTVGAGGASSIDFTSIPNTYTDLVLKVSGRNNSTTQFVGLRFNSSTTGYSSRALTGNQSGASSSSRTDEYVTLSTQSDYTASTFSNAEIYIPNYLSSTAKSFSIDNVSENNSSAAYELRMWAGLWSGTAAITSISLLPLSTTFVQYSTATLYGISKS